MLFGFVSVEASTPGDVEAFTFCLSPRETCVTRTQFSDAASCHALKNQVLTMLQNMDLHLCFYVKYCAGLKIKYPSVIKTMFPLHALYSSC